MARMVYIRRITGVLLAATAVAAAAGCGESTIAKEKAATYVDQWSTSVEPTLRQMAVAPAGKKQFRTRLTNAAGAEQDQITGDEPPYDQFVADAYKSLDYQFQWVEPAGLTDSGTVVWDTLKGVSDHGLDAQDYPLDTIESKLDELDAANARFQALADFQTSKAEKQAAVDWLTNQPVSAFDLDEAHYTELTKTLVESGAGRRMNERLDDYETVSADIAALEAQIEQLLARNVARYARQMKYFRLRDIFIHPDNFDRWKNPNIEGRRPDKAQAVWNGRVVWRTAAKIARTTADQHKVEILHERIRQTLRDALAGSTKQVLAGLAPAQPQYDGLKREYRRYKTLADAGGWAKVEVTRGLHKGSQHKAVKTLKKRLQTEGYYPADAAVDRHYDQALVDAVKAYQTTHQMAVTGKPHHMFWASINVAASRRAQQIKLNMQRWRQSNVRHSDPEYVYINIPDFTAEVWRNQKRAMRFGIVVGNDDLVIDEESDEKTHPNHTPTLSAYIDRVIYNPYWNVTDRIRADEILPKVKTSVIATYKAKLKAMVAGSAGTTKNNAGGTDEAGADTVLTQTRPMDQPFGRPAPSRPSDRDVGRPSTARPSTARPSTARPSTARPSTARAPSRPANSYWSTDADGQVIFDVEAIKALLAKQTTEPAAADAAADSTSDGGALGSRFPYLDPASGKVVVQSTDADHIPGWYEANNYEVMYPGKKWEYVRMKQGDKNSLGKVKVIFPNMHSVYLHDTPAKALFGRDIRAYSHGCMRMSKPLEFAKYLLQQDGQWDDYDVPKMLEEGGYNPIFLHTQIPVHIDYITVRVDDDGHANFLADVYDKDHFDDP